MDSAARITAQVEGILTVKEKSSYLTMMEQV